LRPEFRSDGLPYRLSLSAFIAVPPRKKSGIGVEASLLLVFSAVLDCFFYA